MDCNQFIAEILKKEGVEWIACFPSNPLIEAVAQQGIRPIAFRHERGAVMAADGFSRTSNRKKFGIVAVQSQAGAENALGGVAQAYADNIPILILPGGVSLSELAVQPNYSVSQNYTGVVKRVEAIYRTDRLDANSSAFNLSQFSIFSMLSKLSTRISPALLQSDIRSTDIP